MHYTGKRASDDAARPLIFPRVAATFGFWRSPGSHFEQDIVRMTAVNSVILTLIKSGLTD
ncbi:hypothetical protein GIX45_19430 [Erwinia sp. CPCC 100877]|nr:hypothetical protein [Erwinia sp. CPCC 100877]